MAALDKYPGGINELIRKRNLALSIGEYNTNSNIINSKTILMTNDKDLKKAQKQSESIYARLDTDIYTDKTKTGYNINLGSDITQINKLGGTTQQKNTLNKEPLREKWIEKGQPKIGENKTKTLIEMNPKSLSVKSYRLEKARKNTKNYQYNKVINSCPVNKGLVRG